MVAKQRGATTVPLPIGQMLHNLQAAGFGHGCRASVHTLGASGDDAGHDVRHLDDIPAHKAQVCESATANDGESHANSFTGRPVYSAFSRADIWRSCI